MSAFVVAALGSAVLTGLLIPALRRPPFLDVPNDRSSHAHPIPRSGGLAVMAAIAIAVAVTARSSEWGVTVPALALGLVGLADDLRSLPPSVRLIAQATVGVGTCVVIMATARVEPSALGFVVLGSLGVVAYVNAFNFMDGVNGISALTSVVAGGWFVWVGHVHDIDSLVATGAALAGAMVGFLPWNLRSRVFLGDVGSYGIGALIAGMAVLAWSRGVPGLWATAPLLIYLADTGWTLIRRARIGANLTQAHRDHVYQRLVRSGWSHAAAALWTAITTATICAVTALLYPEQGILYLGLVVAVLGLYICSPGVFDPSRRSRS